MGKHVDKWRLITCSVTNCQAAPRRNDDIVDLGILKVASPYLHSSQPTVVQFGLQVATILLLGGTEKDVCSAYWWPTKSAT